MKSAGSRVRGEANNPATQHSHWFQFTSEENKKIFSIKYKDPYFPDSRSVFSASFTREQHTCIITTPGAGCLDHSRRRCGGGAELYSLADLSLAHFTMSVETFCVTTPANTDTVTLVTRPNTTTNYTTNNVTPAVVSCTDLFSVI